MKTQNQAGRLEQRDHKHFARQIRRLRTKASVECESLEGRKLMTGLGGSASSLMGNAPADLASMHGGGMAQAGMHRYDAAAMGAQSGDLQIPADPGGSGMGATGGSSHSFRAMNDRGGSFDPAAMGLGMPGSGQDRSFGQTSSSGMMGSSQGRWDQSKVPMMSSVDSGNGTSTSAPTTQLGTDLAKLRTDDQAIHDKSQVTPALLATVRKDLEAIDQAKTGTADATALKTLQTDEQTIFASKTTPTDAQQTQLQADRDAVLKSQGVSQTLIDQLATDQLAVKTASNFTAADQATLDADHAAITKDRAATPAPSSAPAAGAQVSVTPQIPAAAATPAAAPSAAALPASAPAGSTIAATPDSATTATPTATPSVAATPAVAAPSTTVATPTTPPAAADPALSQMTSTATAMAMPTGGHHGQFGAMHASAAYHVGIGHHAQSLNHLGSRGRRVGHA